MELDDRRAYKENDADITSHRASKNAASLGRRERERRPMNTHTRRGKIDKPLAVSWPEHDGAAGYKEWRPRGDNSNGVYV